MTFTIDSDNQLNTMYERFLVLAHAYVSFKIRCKDDSKLMRFLGFFVRIFNKRFNKYATTIGSTIYLPKILYGNPHENQIPLIAHEVVHLRDRKRLTTFFYRILYLSPQILAVFSLLSLLAIWFSNWWLLCLLALGLLSPLPAPGRVYIEKRGYLMSLASIYWMYNDGKLVQDLRFRYVKQFTNHSYYFMYAGYGNVLHTWFSIELNVIHAGIYPDNFFKAVHNFIEKERKNA